MRTFGELLTEYMQRTGISDSELARHLGVRRQTIFRWKEGLVARPRSREDVLRCASRLRLTPEESSELLLAAGFPPENPIPFATPTAVPGPAPAPVVIPLQPAASPPTPGILPAPETPESPTAPGATPTVPNLPIAPVEAVPAGRWRARSVPRWVGLALAVVVLLAAASAALLVTARPGAGGSATPAAVYPQAGPGETLIVLGKIGVSGQDQPGYDVTARLQAALQRELNAERFSGTRVAIWPGEIGDGVAVKQSSGASLVIGGTYSGGRVQIALAQSGTTMDQVGLGALVTLPSNVAFTVDSGSTEEVRALALLTLAQLYLQKGEADEARAELTQALASPPAAADFRAALNFFLGYAQQTASPVDLDQALQSFTQSIDLAPDFSAAYLNRGLVYVRENKPLWEEDFARVLSLQPGSMAAHQAICWAYALDAQPQQALSHCDAAVAHDSSPSGREARAIVEAESGKFSEAAADLQAYVDWLKQQPESLRARYESQAAQWLQALEGGTNPFDAQTLAKLRAE